MLKSSKRITITTEAVNSYGFKVSTKGIDLSHFKRNPIMLWEHLRPTGGSKNDVLPLGFWDDIQANGSEITGIPLFDDKDEFAVKIFHKVENGTIRMASAGLVPVTWSEDMRVLEQSVLREASIVGIGANAEALAVALYDEQNNQIKLSESSIRAFVPAITNDYTLQLDAAGLLPKLGLKAGANSEEVMTAISGLTSQNKALIGESLRLHKSIKELQHHSLQLKADALKDTGWDELFKSGKLEGLKLKYPELYRLKFKEKFGKEPQN